MSDTFFSGDLESISPTQIVVSRRVVDVTKLQKVWTPGGRAQMSDLKVGDRIKVWGTLRGDGVVVADEIMSVTNDAGETWFSFKGRVDGISGNTVRALDDVRGGPNTGYYTLSIAGETVYTSEFDEVRSSGPARLSIPANSRSARHRPSRATVTRTAR